MSQKILRLARHPSLFAFAEKEGYCHNRHYPDDRSNNDPSVLRAAAASPAAR